LEELDLKFGKHGNMSRKVKRANTGTRSLRGDKKKGGQNMGSDYAAWGGINGVAV